ncbi:MAG: murein L,D-transpeptidase catalytic domain family protein, partial [Bacteroidota bacterium]|nr:murein L,D-transpeptidase catalytic domain family protein [Bacteroidota bacterium]
ARAVVLHGADYIGNHRVKSGYNGRSFGCPAVPRAESQKIINWIKDGTCLFIFHPSNSYLHGSSILNA